MMLLKTRIQKICKSWTINYGFLLMLFGSLEMNIHYLKDFIGAEWFGVVFVVIGLIVVALRFKTTTAVLENKG